MKERLSDVLKKNSIAPYFLLIAVGAVLMLSAKSMGGGAKTDTAQPEAELAKLLPAEPEYAYELSEYERILEKRLADTLSKAEGVGAVDVVITLSYSGEIELAEDVTYEKTQAAGAGGDEALNITEKREARHVIITGKDGTDAPVVTKRIEPVVEGVIIVAEGGGDALIRASLTKAASALLNLPAHKIEILKMDSER